MDNPETISPAIEKALSLLNFLTATELRLVGFLLQHALSEEPSCRPQMTTAEIAAIKALKQKLSEEGDSDHRHF